MEAHRTGSWIMIVAICSHGCSWLLIQSTWPPAMTGGSYHHGSATHGCSYGLCNVFSQVSLVISSSPIRRLPRCCYTTMSGRSPGVISFDFQLGSPWPWETTLKPRHWEDLAMGWDLSAWDIAIESRWLSRTVGTETLLITTLVLVAVGSQSDCKVTHWVHNWVLSWCTSWCLWCSNVCSLPHLSQAEDAQSIAGSIIPAVVSGLEERNTAEKGCCRLSLWLWLIDGNRNGIRDAYGCFIMVNHVWWRFRVLNESEHFGAVMSRGSSLRESWGKYQCHRGRHQGFNHQGSHDKPKKEFDGWIVFDPKSITWFHPLIKYDWPIHTEKVRSSVETSRCPQGWQDFGSAACHGTMNIQPGKTFIDHEQLPKLS